MTKQLTINRFAWAIPLAIGLFVCYLVPIIGYYAGLSFYNAGDTWNWFTVGDTYTYFTVGSNLADRIPLQFTGLVAVVSFAPALILLCFIVGCGYIAFKCHADDNPGGVIMAISLGFIFVALAIFIGGPLLVQGFSAILNGG